jgi:aspartate/methionine/tyrosine aminotransferase
MARFPANEIISLVGAAPRFDLGESIGPDLRLAELVDPSEFGDLPLSYATAEGDPRLRRAIAEAHGVAPDDVIVTVGGMHALFLLAFILCDAGDETVTTAPLFPLARNALAVIGAEVQTLTLAFDHGYRLDLVQLRDKLSPRTKLVSLASPQNPSGVAIPADTLREILPLMAARCPAAHLLVDETYREAAYGDAPVAPSAVELSPRVVSVASLSKCHGAPGLRLGWAITRNPELRRQLIVGKFNTVVSCSPVDEALALKVFERRERIIAERRARLAQGLQRTADWVRANSSFVDWVRPDAGALCCVRLKPRAFDGAAVDRFYKIAADKGVRVANGAWFGDQARVFRLGFGFLSMADFAAALDALGAALKQAAQPGVTDRVQRRLASGDMSDHRRVRPRRGESTSRARPT